MDLGGIATPLFHLYFSFKPMCGLKRMMFYKGKPEAKNSRSKVINLPPREAQLKQLQLNLMGWKLLYSYDI
tara:strand:+ start:500 stop:712 length:213 start_codon:yes stop_codon:yes gene_type:complete